MKIRRQPWLSKSRKKDREPFISLSLSAVLVVLFLPHSNARNTQSFFCRHSFYSYRSWMVHCRIPQHSTHSPKRIRWQRRSGPITFGSSASEQCDQILSIKFLKVRPPNQLGSNVSITTITPDSPYSNWSIFADVTSSKADDGERRFFFFLQAARKVGGAATNSSYHVKLCTIGCCTTQKIRSTSGRMAELV